LRLNEQVTGKPSIAMQQMSWWDYLQDTCSKILIVLFCERTLHMIKRFDRIRINPFYN
jgi:hypothetical protein